MADADKRVTKGTHKTWQGCGHRCRILMLQDTMKENEGVRNVRKFVCTVCGYVYDEAEGDLDSGLAPGTKWEDVPGSWTCPLCGVTKDDFEEQVD